jgi:hypothetical protein
MPRRSAGTVASRRGIGLTMDLGGGMVMARIETGTTG